MKQLLRSAVIRQIPHILRKIMLFDHGLNMNLISQIQTAIQSYNKLLQGFFCLFWEKESDQIGNFLSTKLVILGIFASMKRLIWEKIVN